MKRQFLSLVIAFLSARAHAQTNEFTDKIFTLRLFADVPSYSIDVQSKVSRQHVLWKPNLRSLTGADVSINGFVGGGYSWANNDDPGSAPKKGVTDYQDYRAAMT